MTIQLIRSYFQAELLYLQRFHTLSELSKPLHILQSKGANCVADFPSILFDVWFSFFKEECIIQDENAVSSFHKDVITNLMQTEECRHWRQFTKNDELFSVLTTLVIGEELLSQLERQSKKKKQEEKKKVEEQLQKNKEQQQNQDLSLIEKERLQFQQKIMEKQIDRLNKQMNEMDAQATPKIQMTELVHQLTKSRNDMLKTKQAVVQLSSLEGKKMNSTPLKDQFVIAEQVAKQDFIKKIAEMTGRFKKIAMKKQKTKQRVTMERKEIALGQEIARLLPMELANFVLPKSKLDFYRRFAEQQTFIFGQKGKDTVGRGPIIICMDESSSMLSMKAESKALCIALLSIASMQRRDFAIVPFASDIGEVLIFPKGKSSAEQVLHFADQFLSGGTNYEKPLKKSLEILSSSQFNKADLLFVTDGSSFLSRKFIDEFNEVKKKRKFECTSIVLANLYNAVDETVIAKFSDRIIHVENLLEADDVFSIV